MERIEPWGDRRLDILFARLTAFLANMIRDEHKRLDPYTAGDFMIDWSEVWESVLETVDPRIDDDEVAKATTEALAVKVSSLNVWFGGEPS